MRRQWGSSPSRDSARRPRPKSPRPSACAMRKPLLSLIDGQPEGNASDRENTFRALPARFTMPCDPAAVRHETPRYHVIALVVGTPPCGRTGGTTCAVRAACADRAGYARCADDSEGYEGSGNGVADPRVVRALPHTTGAARPFSRESPDLSSIPADTPDDAERERSAVAESAASFRRWRSTVECPGAACGNRIPVAPRFTEGQRWNARLRGVRPCRHGLPPGRSCGRRCRRFTRTSGGP